MGSFLLGLGAGIVGGLLIAPRPGSYYRNVLGNKASEAVQKGKEAVGHQIENLAVNTNQGVVYQR